MTFKSAEGVMCPQKWSSSRCGNGWGPVERMFVDVDHVCDVVLMSLLFLCFYVTELQYINI